MDSEQGKEINAEIPDTNIKSQRGSYKGQIPVYEEGLNEKSTGADFAQTPALQPVIVALSPCFTPISNPDAVYQSSTTKIDISAIPDFTMLSSVSDGFLTVSFNTTVEKLQVPSSWSNWGSPSNAESSTPAVLFSLALNTLTLNMSRPVTTFGFELSPDILGTYNYTVDFYQDSNLYGTITRQVFVPSGSRLFAATAVCSPFNKVIISIAAGQNSAGFAIAQIRYVPAPAQLTRGIDILGLS
ncbi:MAG TPA: hypothetical protein DCY71_07720 [Clostridiaceae bacterium]|nr:hypothetical protein [Clostridiaceae bacterium]